MTAPTRSRPWSPADLLTLAALWGAPGHSLATLARRFARTPYAVYCAAARAGLPLGCPEGWESLAAAARRTGMVPRALASALAAAGVRPSTGWRNPMGAARGMGANRVVMVAEVDRAVESWLARESVEEAARRAGVGATVLRRWLRRAGVEEPRRGAHWRVGEGEVAAALGARAAARRAAPPSPPPPPQGTAPPCRPSPSTASTLLSPAGSHR